MTSMGFFDRMVVLQGLLNKYYLVSKFEVGVVIKKFIFFIAIYIFFICLITIKELV